MEQLTKEQAVAMYESGAFKDMSFDEIVKFQLFQDRLCMPFDKFHEAMEKVLGRSIWTHEFADREGLIEEYLGTRSAPTMDEIINMIPADKRIVIGI